MGRSSRRTTDVIVIGGGVAGLSVARVLAEQRVRVLLLERAPRLASQASGNNAAIFRPLELDAASAVLPRRSRELMAQWFGPALLAETGLLLVSQHRDEVDLLCAQAASAGVAHARLEQAKLWERAPSLAGGETRHALLLRDGGVLDVPALTSGLAEQARGFGAELRTDASVRALLQVGGRIAGVILADGAELEASRVIVAAGAWNGAFGVGSGAALPLLPLKRHLVQLRASAGVGTPEPVVWRLEDELYYRRQGTGVLASPCDETCVDAGDDASEPAALELLQQKLRRTAPLLAGGAVERAWACLRTFAPDRELVVGADPRVPGLHWFGGLGGRGMSIALAAAECLAAIVIDAQTVETRANIAAASPARLWPPRTFG